MTADRPRIDILIERISDPGLRDQLRAEMESISGHRKFGLVFEGHAPEAIRIPGAKIRRDSTVQYREGKDQRVWRVLRARAGAATLVNREGEKIEGVSTSDLIVARELGDPVYPGFTPLGSVERGGDKPHHLVIQGENYHALQTLLYTHKESVDLIYIDPPYNTGAGDWIYNDRYVGDTDAYRHSKWLSFMEKRLELARKLLKPTGVIIVAIDDNEHHRLRMLLDQEFGEKNFLTNVVWQGSVNNMARFTAGGIDYMLAYAKDAQRLVGDNAKWVEEKVGASDFLAAADDAWKRSDGDSDRAGKLFRQWRKSFAGEFEKGLSSYSDIDEFGRLYTKSDMTQRKPASTSRYDVIHPATGKPVPMAPGGWIYSPETMKRLLSEGRVAFGKDETTVPRFKRFLSEMQTQSARQLVYADRFHSSSRLQSVLGAKDFPFPKDVDVIARWISTVTSQNPEAVILDFFAGTGTTAEAVMQLNKQDGGRRQSIIVTNNELSKKDSTGLAKAGAEPGDPAWEAEGVFEKVTRPRLEAVVTGVRADGTKLTEPSANGVGKAIKGHTGYAENVSFVKLNYLERDSIELGAAFKQVAELLWLKAGAVGPVISEQGDSFSFTDHYGVLFDTDLSAGFEAEAARRSVSVVFIITDSTEVFGAFRRQLPESIRTVHLYRNYLSNFEINTRKAI